MAADVPVSANIQLHTVAGDELGTFAIDGGMSGHQLLDMILHVHPPAQHSSVQLCHDGKTIDVEVTLQSQGIADAAVIAYVTVFDFRRALLHASEKGDRGGVDSLLLLGKDHEERQSVLWDSLIAAAAGGHFQVVEVLLMMLLPCVQTEIGNPSELDRDSDQQDDLPQVEAFAEKLFGEVGPFQAAVMSAAGPQFQVMGLLLLEHSYRANALYHRYESNSEICPCEFVPEAIMLGMLQSLPKSRNWYMHALTCWPSLHVACFFGLPTYAEELLAAGADPMEKCTHNMTPNDLVGQRFKPRSDEHYYPQRCTELVTMLESKAVQATL